MKQGELLYILENQIPVATDDILQWGQWIADPNNKRVDLTEINGRCGKGNDILLEWINEMS